MEQENWDPAQRANRQTSITKYIEQENKHLKTVKL